MVPDPRQDPTAVARDVCARLVAAGLRPGLMRPRKDRPVKNGRWYVIGANPHTVTRCGAGDLSLADLRAAGPALGPGWAFVVLPEDPFEPSDAPPPALADLAATAIYAVLDGKLHTVDHVGARNRAGTMHVSPGYRYASTGRLIRTAPVRLPAITPDELAHQLTR